MMRIPLTWLTGFALSLNILGCGADAPQSVDPVASADEDDDGDESKTEAWDSMNNPAFVDNTFSYLAPDLPVQGEAATTPWAGDYWATARDSINHRWDGNELSPAEKIEKAFGVSGFPKWVTDNVGIYGHGTKACASDADCTDQNDGSSCVAPRGVTITAANKAGRCTPGWWGICHGWAPAALVIPAPVNPVTKNGVTFYPGDIHALASFAFQANLPVKFLSQRCNKNGDKVGMDNNGRPRDAECRDMNPGSMHVVVTNMLGLRKVGLVEDRTWDSEVWNQPVRRYKVTNAVGGKLKEITKGEAVSMLGLDLTFTEAQSTVTLRKNETKTGTHRATAAGRVIIKTAGSGDADLYVKKGAAASASSYDCKSDGGTATESCTLDVAAGDVLNWTILGYSDTSTANLSIGAGQSNPVYTYNTQAVRFFHVEMDLDYITEASPERQASNADSHTRTDHLSYILEADTNAKLLGGEWLGQSQTHHPDFMWWPTGNPTSNQGGFTFAMINELAQQAKAGGTTPVPGPSTTTKVVFAPGTTVSNGYSKYATLGVPSGARVTFTMTGTGNADLYVRIGRNPTVTVFTCKSTNPDSNESCSVTAPGGGGTYYVRARGLSTGTTVGVSATISN